MSMNLTMMPDEPHAVTARVAAAIPSDKSLRLLAAVAAGATSGDSLTTEPYGRARLPIAQRCEQPQTPPARVCDKPAPVGLQAQVGIEVDDLSLEPPAIDDVQDAECR